MLLLTFTVAGRTAITELSGLAVAQSQTLWKNVKDATIGDNLLNGIPANAMMFFDGVGLDFDRLRGSIANGILVDVTRQPGSNQTPADGFANPSTFQGTWSLTGIFNRTANTWDRWRGNVAPTQQGALLNSRTVSAANTATTITLTGVANTRAHLYRLQARCSAGSSFITVADGATTLYETDGGTVPSGTQYAEWDWTPGLTATTGNNLVITLASCGAGNISVLSVVADQF